MSGHGSCSPLCQLCSLAVALHACSCDLVEVYVGVDIVKYLSVSLTFTVSG